MKITAQEEYGLRCLLRLARANEGQSLTIPEIAGAEGMSVPYVAKLLAVLRQGGVIESVRGRSGGYRLAGTPADHTLGAVLLVLGEPLYDEADYCQQHAGSEANGSCVHHDDCTLRVLWQTLEQWMRHALGRITLADLLQAECHIYDILRARLAEAMNEPAAAAIHLHVLN